MTTISHFLPLILLLFLFGCFENSREPLFQEIDPDYSGIYFSNDLRESEQLNILTFEYFYNGAGTGVGDIDNDGLPDVCFSANMKNGSLYRNLGGFQFKDITEESGFDTHDHWSTGVSMVDINQDGWLDIYVCCSGPYGPEQRRNLCFFNNQDGTFTEKATQIGLDDSGHSTQAAFFDYDLDGDLDVYILTNITGKIGPNVIRPKQVNGEHPSTDRLYRNDDGVFVDVSAKAGIVFEGYGLGVSITDLNQDGWPDILVSNDYVSNDLLYMNRGDGTFSEESAHYFRHTSYSAMGHDVADINNDGLQDVVTVDMLPPDNFRRKIMIGSINYDRYRSEIISGYSPQFMRNTLQLNQGFSPGGRPLFSEIGQLAGIHSTDWSWSPLIADFDSDGFKDLLITNGYPKDITNKDFSSYKMNQLTSGNSSDALETALFKALQTLEGAHIHNFAFKNTGEFRFEDVSKEWGFSTPDYSYGAAYADLDGDGDLDYIVNRINAPALVYKNTQTSNRSLRIALQPFSKAIGAKVWVFTDSSTQFQEMSPCRGYLSSVEPILHFGLGPYQLADSVKILWPRGQTQILIGPFADTVLTVYQKYAQSQSMDLPTTQQKANALCKQLDSRLLGIDYSHTESHYADFKVQPLLPHKYSQQGPPLCSGDFNGDGLEDFFVGGAFRQSGQLFIQMPDGTFLQRPLEINSPNYEEDTASATFDADGDGDLDLYVCSGGSEFGNSSPYYQDRLYLNDGNGFFTKSSSALPEIRVSTSTVAPCDFDGDGDIDLFVGGRIVPENYAEIPHSMLLVNQDGTFVNRTSEYAPELMKPGRITDAEWADMNQDGKPDLIVVGEWMPLTVFQNTGSGFVSLVIPQSVGWWNTVTIADIDQDGDKDFIAGNLGLNSPFQSSEGHPVKLHVGDFGNNGRLDALMTYTLNGEEVPVHFRDDMRSWLLPLRKKYLDYTSYASATWDEMFPEQSEQTIRVNSLASVWVENQNNGYIMRDLPLEAQFSPISSILPIYEPTSGICMAFVLGGNSFATEPNTGQYDALSGLLVQNKKGGFSPILPSESGIFLPGDIRSLILLNQSQINRTLLIAGENNGALQIFNITALETLR